MSNVTMIREKLKMGSSRSVALSGHSYALSRSSRLVSRAKGVEELWNGLSQFDRVKSFVSMDRGEIARKLTAIRDTLVQHDGIIVNVTAGGETLDTAVAQVASRFASFGVPRPRKRGTETAESFYPLIHPNPSKKPHYRAGHPLGAWRNCRFLEPKGSLRLKKSRLSRLLGEFARYRSDKLL